MPPVATAQTLSHWKATSLKRGLLVNFGEKRLVGRLKRLSLWSRWPIFTSPNSTQLFCILRSPPFSVIADPDEMTNPYQPPTEKSKPKQTNAQMMAKRFQLATSILWAVVALMLVAAVAAVAWLMLDSAP